MTMSVAAAVVASVAALSTGFGHAAPSDQVDLCGYDRALCNVTSFSGLVPVSKTGSLFYWYFVPEDYDVGANSGPLILWLQGGPGSSSMIGALNEIGPLTLDQNARLVRQPAGFSWVTRFPVLFVDSPVGVGWSDASDDSGYARDETHVARDLTTLLAHFAELHPEAPKHLVIAGESYGGHYIPALGSYMLKHGGPFTLEAVAIGDGLTDPATQVMTKPASAFALGLIDEKQLAVAQGLATQAHDLALAGQFLQAVDKRGEMEDVVANASQLNLMDVRTSIGYDYIFERMSKFFAADAVKDLLHVPRHKIFGNTSDKAGDFLTGDIMRSQKPAVEVLLNSSVQVLLYQAQFDWKDGVTANEAWIRTLQWHGAAGYLDAPRDIWTLPGGEIAGYWRRFGNLEQVVVRAAGHLAPMNQPAACLDMLTKLVEHTGRSAAAPFSSDQMIV